MGNSWDRVNSSRRRLLKAGAGATAGLLFAPKRIATSGAPVEAGAALSSPSTSPSWTRDLVVYEIATKGFTSPHGPESGTFNSLKERLPYLQELGITGIWLTGHSAAPPRYFYNIWSQYANLEPDKIEPSLGAPEDFRSLIEAAHQHEIRIFLDVHVHGVHPTSSLIKQHPKWFRKWLADPSMVDFDWYGGHTDLDDWWVNVWTNCISQYGVDGFRLDIGIARPDLWARIRSNAATLGHEIVIFEEGAVPIAGLTDFSQAGARVSDGPETFNEMLVQNLPGFYDRKFGRAGDYQVEIRYADGSRAEGSVNGKGTLRVRLDGLTTDEIGRDGDRLDGIPDIQLTVDNVSDEAIDDIVVKDDRANSWRYRTTLAVKGTPPSLQIYVATLGHGWPSVMLSCHDRGWEGFPADKNPYVAQGSRALFGYTVLFSGMIPVFFSGEEFDATFTPIPWESPHFLGAEGAGKGRWLYGCMLDWNELNQPAHRAMLEDVKQMLAVRKREPDLLAAVPDQEEPKLKAVPFESEIAVPVPYIRWNGRAAVIVAANRDTSRDALLELRFPLQAIGMAGHASFKATDLWPAGETRLHSDRDLASFALEVKRDKTPRGGLRLLRIEPNT